MTTSNLIILSNKEHPLYEEFKKLPFHFYDLEKDEPSSGKETRYRDADCVFDMTLVTSPIKEKLLRHICVQFKAPVISDLSCHWGEGLMTQFPRLAGGVSLAFKSPQGAVESFCREEELKPFLSEFIAALNLKEVSVSSPGHGFIYPRTISMLINEAYYSLEDKLAEKEDMDTAMKFGVNYPMGLFEWSELVGARPIAMLLEDLYQVTKEPRYRLCPALKLRALKKEIL